MLNQTRHRIEGHWARRFGMPIPGLSPVMVGSTGLHVDAALVLLLGGHAYVDAPPAHLDAVAEIMCRLTPADVCDASSWEQLAAGPILGPADHFWADRSTMLAPDVATLDAEGLVQFSRHIGDREWREAGFNGQVVESFGIVEDGEVLAASVVTPMWGWPVDVGVAVRPDRRGLGYERRVATTALAAAVGLSGFAGYRVERTDMGARTTAFSLGLSMYGSNLSVPL